MIDERAEFEAWLDYWWDTSEWSGEDKEEGFLAFKAARRTQDISTAAIQNIIADDYIAKVRELVELIAEMRDDLCVLSHKPEILDIINRADAILDNKENNNNG